MESAHTMNDLLQRCDPSGSALLDWLRPQLDDLNLWRMASNGTPDEENYYHALKSIQQGEPIPVPLRWVPLEILNQNRWREPDGYTLPDGREYRDIPSTPERTRGHLERAFCCTVLLKAADEPETLGNIFAENDTMVQLLVSVLFLGREASRGMLRLLCWRILRMSERYEEFPFFPMAVLLLCASLFEPDQDSTDLIRMVEWVTAEEAQSRDEQGELCESEEWLLGLTNFTQRHHVWRRVTQEVLLDPNKDFPEPAARKMREVAKRLSA